MPASVPASVPVSAPVVGFCLEKNKHDEINCTSSSGFPHEDRDAMAQCDKKIALSNEINAKIA